MSLHLLHADSFVRVNIARMAFQSAINAAHFIVLSKISWSKEETLWMYVHSGP